MIELPAKVSLLKLNIFSKEDIEDLKEKEPDIYDAIVDNIFEDKTGLFVTRKVDNPVKVINPRLEDWYKYIPKKYRTKYKKLGVEEWNKFAESYDGDMTPDEEVNSRGMQIIAIPKTEKIPSWLDPYIDYTTLVNNILAPFMSVMEIFGYQTIDEGKTKKAANRKTAGFSNIIKL